MWYSVYAELRKQDTAKEIDLNRLKYVYISHMDDDHMGSLKTLLYYMYFIKNRRVIIICHQTIWEQLQSYLSDMDGYVENGNKIKTNLFSTLILKDDGYNTKLSTNIGIKLVQAVHFTPSYGVYLTWTGDTRDYSALISSDSKYSVDIARYANTADVVFHDYSDWNNEPSQVHCCEKDYEKYGTSNKYKFIKYHNNGLFNVKWNHITDLRFKCNPLAE